MRTVLAVNFAYQILELEVWATLSALGEAYLGSLVHVKGNFNIGDTFNVLSICQGRSRGQGVTLTEGKIAKLTH